MKVDLFREHAEEYEAEPEPRLIEVKPATYLVISGTGEPGGEQFQSKALRLRAVAEAINHLVATTGGIDYVVGKQEAFFEEDPTSWTLAIRSPDFLGAKDVAKGNKTPAANGDTTPVELLRLREGTCIQALAIGRYHAPTPLTREIRRFADAGGWVFAGRQHRIYLTLVPKRTGIHLCKTILRQPVIQPDPTGSL